MPNPRGWFELVWNDSFGRRNDNEFFFAIPLRMCDQNLKQQPPWHSPSPRCHPTILGSESGEPSWSQSDSDSLPVNLGLLIECRSESTRHLTTAVAQHLPFRVSLGGPKVTVTVRVSRCDTGITDGSANPRYDSDLSLTLCSAESESSESDKRPDGKRNVQ